MYDSLIRQFNCFSSMCIVYDNFAVFLTDFPSQLSVLTMLGSFFPSPFVYLFIGHLGLITC